MVARIRRFAGKNKKDFQRALRVRRSVRFSLRRLPRYSPRTARIIAPRIHIHPISIPYRRIGSSGKGDKFCVVIRPPFMVGENQPRNLCQCSSVVPVKPTQEYSSLRTASGPLFLFSRRRLDSGDMKIRSRQESENVHD